MQDGPSLGEFITALGIVGIIIGLSCILVYLMSEYVDPWRAKRKALRRVKGWNVVTLNRRDLSRDSYCENKMTPHWFRPDVGLWCLENCQGNYGTIPIFGVCDAYKVTERSYAFERVDDAMMFKMVWG
jgi:hypothetical protein